MRDILDGVRSARSSGYARPRPAARRPRGSSAAAERAVEARPARAVGQLLLEPVERAEPAAEVVDEVHERRLARARHDRAAVLERAVVAEDDVQHRLGERGREAVDLLDLAAHEVVAERDLALQAPGVGQVDRERRRRRRPRACRCRAAARPVTATSRSMPGNVALSALTACATVSECSSRPCR